MHSQLDKFRRKVSNLEAQQLKQFKMKHTGEKRFFEKIKQASRT